MQGAWPAHQGGNAGDGAKGLMERIATHYDNLKVARNAPPEVIRAAYKTLVQKYHPDKNSDPDAPRIMKLLNQAYAILSDPDARAAHDEWIASTEQRARETSSAGAAREAPQAASPPPRQPVREVILPTGGTALASALPTGALKTLEARLKGKYRDQVLVLLPPERGYAWGVAMLAAGTPLVLSLLVLGERWSQAGTLVMGAVWAVGALILAPHLRAIMGYMQSSLRPALIVTELYLIETSFVRATYWPLLDVALINPINHFENGMYRGTSVGVSAGGVTRRWSFDSESRYMQFGEAIARGQYRYTRAVDTGDQGLLSGIDDLGDHAPADAAMPVSQREGLGMYRWGCLVLATVVWWGFSISNKTVSKSTASAARVQQPARPATPAYPTTPPATQSLESVLGAQPTPAVVAPTPAVAPEPIDYIELQLGSSRVPRVSGYVPGEPLLNFAGLSTLSIDNTRPQASDVLIKLVDLDDYTSDAVRTVFVKGGTLFTLRDISPGRYNIRYLTRHGTVNKSEEFTLTQTETYQGTEYDNMTLTLYTVPNGNMRMQTIPLDQF